MKKYKFILILFGLFTLIAAIVPRDSQPIENFAFQKIPSDSAVLKKISIYICKGHYFEWCTEQSACGHCNEDLEKINLWEYYKLLECEDCQKFFEDNYPKFIQAQPKL